MLAGTTPFLVYLSGVAYVETGLLFFAAAALLAATAICDGSKGILRRALAAGLLAGFAAGCGIVGDGICGAYAACVYFISSRYGRRLEDLEKDPDDPSAGRKLHETFALVRKIHEKFIEKYGTVICQQIHRKLYGRPYYIVDKDEYRKFEEKGAHDWGCTSVCGEAARWTVELLEGQ